MNSPQITTLSRISTYDPLLQKEDAFIANFVARERELKQLHRFVKEASNTVLTKHCLIIGQRGMGKTSLLRRLALKIRDDEELTQLWIPLNFSEEQYNIAQLNNLWQNCADSLAEWCDRNGHTEQANNLDDAVENNDEILPLINQIAKYHGRRLVLFIDNLHTILNVLPSQQQWLLREILQADNGPLLIAASSEIPKNLSDRDAAFYEFFQLYNLKALSLAEMRSCLNKIAILRDEQGKAVQQDLIENPSRIKILQVLCGGNPRTLALIYQVLESMSALNQAQLANTPFIEVLEGVLENTTAIYKARTDALPDQQKQIFDAIALHWDPIQTKRLAELTKLPSSSLSPQLKRMKIEGLIEQVNLTGKKRGYQLTERFYNIWYLMRCGKRRSKERLRWLTRFISSYYSSDELNHHARKLLQQEPVRNDYTTSVYLALEESPLKLALKQQITIPLLDKTQEEINNLIGEEDYSENILSHYQREKIIRENFSNIGISKERTEHFITLLSESMGSPKETKGYIASESVNCSEQLIDKLEDVFLSERKKLTQMYGDRVFKKLTKYFKQGLITNGDLEGLQAILVKSTDIDVILGLTMINYYSLDEGFCYFINKLIPNVADIDLSNYEQVFLINIGDLLGHKLSRFSEAEQVYRKAIAKDSQSAKTWNALGNLFQVHLARYDEAEQAYRQAISIDSKFAAPWVGLGNLFHDHLARYDEAEQAYRQGILIDSKHAYSWHKLGDLLQITLARYKEAEQAYREAISIDSKFAAPWVGLGNLFHHHLARYDEAEQAYRQVILIDSKHAYSWHKLGNLLQITLARYEEAEQAYREAISIDSKYAAPWVGLSNLFHVHLARYEEAEQAYQQAISIDADFVYPWTGLGNLLQDHLARYEEAEQAYRQAISIDSKFAAPWVGLGSLYHDHLDDYEQARDSYINANTIDPQDMNSINNLLWLDISQNKTIDNDLIQSSNIPELAKLLLNAALAVKQGNIGQSTKVLTQVLNDSSTVLWTSHRDDLLRLTRLIKKAEFTNYYMDWLNQEGFNIKLTPYYVAVEAYFADGDGMSLLNKTNPEVRVLAEPMYRCLAGIAAHSPNNRK